MKDLWCLRLRTNPILSGSQSPQVIGLCCCTSTSRPCWGCLSDEPFLQECFQGCHSHLRSIAGVHSAGPEKLVNSSNSCILGYLMSLTLLTAWYSPEFQANFQKEGSILPWSLLKHDQGKAERAPNDVRCPPNTDVFSFLNWFYPLEFPSAQCNFEGLESLSSFGTCILGITTICRN